MMKLHFEPDLDYQLEAIESVCDLFRGQEICRSEFTVVFRDPTNTPYDEDLFPESAPPQQLGLGTVESDLGIGNRMNLLDEELLKNVNKIQLDNVLPPSTSLDSRDFTVEMETGTGKTYVYLRTIFELNKRYGFTKFVIVVPSIAIKEGVYHSLEITEDHFRALYAGESFEYFLYDSSKLGQVRNFATSPNIQIMVVTVGAINKKDVNNLYKDSEKTGGEKPIDLIKSTNPIIIVDEPQSVDGGLKGQGKQALDAMNPLCTLRYSATHAEKHHMVYRLDAVDAYDRKLVKQIEVASATIADAFNKPYVRLISVINKRNVITARVEIDVDNGKSVSRKEVTVQDGDDLEQTTGRSLYADCRIGEIRAAKDDEYMELRVPGGEMFLRPGEAWGDVDSTAVQRQMIRRTIKEHLDKELRLRSRGIKVLTLFFIDEVAKYRQYDEDGNAVKGEYAAIFEEEYRRAAKIPGYDTLFKDVDLDTAAEDVHNGYFSIDKKGGWSDTKENNATNRENAERAYNLIMKDKEDLLSLNTPLKFIFSHSALREGWDNPNVFQICTLRDIRTERERRQTIGRGLRLCVNQEGHRLRGFETNTLTVVATESYQDFAEKLQKEIEDDTGIRFGVVEKHQFAGISITDEEGKVEPLGQDKSEKLWNFLQENGFVDKKSRILDKLREALKKDTLEVPAEFGDVQAQVTHMLRKLAGRLEVKNADERRQIRTRKEVYCSEEFKELWSRIKYKTTYRVAFDNNKLLKECVVALRDAPPIPKTRLQWHKADIAIGKAGIEAKETSTASAVTIDDHAIELPDLLTELQDRTHLTRRTIYRIITESKRLDDFKNNPQQYIEIAADAINRRKRLAIVDGIKYERLGDEYYYAQELFESEELTGYLKNLLPAQKSVYENVVYDFGVEKAFAEDMEKHEDVKLYTKLPGWFRVPTPLGTYNPDWAVLIERNGEERLYFVVETKGSLFADDLREKERGKTRCGEAHFEALNSGNDSVRYKVANSVDNLLTGI